MKKKLLIQIILTLVVLFGLGGLCGYTVATRLGAGRPAWARSPEWAQCWLQVRMKMDFDAIEAAPEQQVELRPVYDRLLADFKSIQAEAESKLREAFIRHGRDLEGKLTPAQREAYRKLSQEINAKRCVGEKKDKPESKPMP
jgi:hypothetical protein